MTANYLNHNLKQIFDESKALLIFFDGSSMKVTVYGGSVSILINDSLSVCRSDNMGGKNRDIEHKFLLEVMAIYKSLPALWKIKYYDYMNRDKKADEYNVLLQKYKEHFPEATLHFEDFDQNENRQKVEDNIDRVWGTSNI